MQKTFDIPNIDGICGCKTQYKSILIFISLKTFFYLLVLFGTTFKIGKLTYSLIDERKTSHIKIIVFFLGLKLKMKLEIYRCISSICTFGNY